VLKEEKKVKINISIIGRWKFSKIYFALIYFFGFETYRPIGR
jgi:hypothetical protein